MREEPRASTEGASTAGKIVGSDGCSGTEPPIGRRQRARRDWSAEPRETLPLPSCRAKPKGHARFTKDAVRVRSKPGIFNAVAARDGISQSVPALRRRRRARASDGQCEPQPCRSARFKRADFGLPKGREGVLAFAHRPRTEPARQRGAWRILFPIRKLVSSAPRSGLAFVAAVSAQPQDLNGKLPHTRIRRVQIC